jgi:DNA-binding FadR family transcriptional regulator
MTLDRQSMSSSFNLPQAPRTSLVDSALELMRSQIESGAWKIDEKIPKEQELADMLHVSRNTVREAVRVLSHARVLEVRQGDGTYVRTNVDPAEVMRRVGRASQRDHFELRAILETEAARLAATRRTEKDLAKLHQLLKARGDTCEEQRLAEFVDRDLAFHTAVARAAHNSALEQLYRYFSAAVRFNTLAALTEADLPEPGAAAHAKILDAIERQDPEAAAKAARAVIKPLITKLTSLLRE